MQRIDFFSRITLRDTARWMALFLFVFSLSLGSKVYAVSLNHTPDRQIADAILKKVYPACIKLYGIDSLTKRQNAAPFSAVVVSSEGHILTVAHATKPGNLYRVLFPDGKEGMARALGRLVTDSSTNLPDVAMMKMEGERSWPYAEMGWSSSLAENQLCFGWSYPETLLLNQPFLRIGRILNPLDAYGFVQSSCIMEPGDSGGPLFDALGRVVALHSRIDGPEGRNYEVPINIYRRYWSALQKNEGIDQYPTTEDPIGLDPLIKELHAQPMANRIEKSRRKSLPVFTITSTINADSVQILGTGFSLPKNKQVIVTKSTLVGQYPVLKYGKKEYALKVLARDKTNDLIALQAPVKLRETIRWTSIADDVLTTDDVGRRIWTAISPAEIKNGVVGMAPLNMPAWQSSGSISAQLQEINGLPTILHVDSLGPAYIAGLQKDDKIVLLNGNDVASAEKINKEFMNYFPGDTVRVSWIRGEDSLASDLVLTNKLLRENNHPANNIQGGKSIRRDGFPSVFLHDSRIHSYECGSPIFNAYGKCVGLNIARYSHTASLAIPAQVLLAFLQNEELE
ncbi:PDZ domain-containing protein [Sphingobacterium olei]|uniref:PDZ domain-containing protein n=1 Tax=Sphingobacterium olei TaxID=2571155 RepID=A0A4U0NYL2_9SPHI|nr:trypsin-like peptidase domain-containing protein [Sphingobacterium olei]TJZ59956.1 PDZ domain-containing protein [Sphingobacterium olei]